MKYKIPKILLSLVILTILFYFGTLFSNKVEINNTNEIKKGKVQLIITPEYDTYLHNQGVWILCNLVNISNEDYYLTEVMDWYSLNFKITNSEGEVLSHGLTVNEIPSKDSLVLKRNENFETLVNLDWFFAARQIEDYYSNEIYEISASYQGIESNQIRIEFRPPQSDDEEVFNKTFKLYGYYISVSENNLSELLDLLSRYPTSKYTPQLLHSIFLYLKSQPNSSRFNSIFNNHINSFKDSYENFFIIQDYKYFLKNKFNYGDEMIEEKVSELSSRFSSLKFEKSLKSIENSDFLLSKINSR